MRRYTTQILSEFLPELAEYHERADKNRSLSLPAGRRGTRRVSIVDPLGQEQHIDESEAVSKLKKIQLIDNHKEKLSQLRKHQVKISEIRKILYETRDAYDLKYRTVLTCFFASELEEIIISSITRFDSLDYNKEKRESLAEQNMDDVKYKSPIAQLVHDARRFTYAHHAIVGIETAYAKMTHQDLVDELIQLESNIAEKERELFELQERVDHFKSGFKMYRRRWWCNPYKPLKRLLEAFTHDCMTDEEFVLSSMLDD